MAEKPGGTDGPVKVGCANCGAERTAGAYCESCGFKPKDEIDAESTAGSPPQQ